MPIGTIAGKNNFGANGLDAYIQYAAVQTGATGFDANTTTLNSEVLRTNSNGGFSDVTTYSAVNRTSVDYVRRTRTFYRVFSITTSYNLTGFGLTPSSSGGTMSLVGAFRQNPNDEGSSAITISVQNGDQLQLIFQDITDLPYQLQSGSISVAGVGTITVNRTFFRNNNNDTANNQLFQGFNPTFGGGNSFVLIGTISSAGASETGVTQAPTTLATKGSPTVASYTAGNFYRDKSVSFATSESNGAVHGFVLNYAAGGQQAGFKAHFTSPTNFTKSNTQTLALSFRSSWDWL